MYEIRGRWGQMCKWGGVAGGLALQGGNLFVDCQLLYEVIMRYEHSE